MIGDVLTSSILFEALRDRYPKAQLHYLVYEHTTPVLKNNPNIDQLILFNPKDHRSKLGLFQLIKQVRDEKYDVVIDVYSKINSAAITCFSGAPNRISYKKWYTGLAYTKTYEKLKKAKTSAGLAIENRLQFLQALDKDFSNNIKPKIYLTQAEKDKARYLLHQYNIDTNQPVCMISILGSSEEKSYPKLFMAEILNYIAEYEPIQILLNYIPNQIEDVNAIFNLCKPETQKQIVLNFYAKSLREFLAVTSHCQAVIGNEGGAINMAKALNIPTFAIFSPALNKENWNMFEDGDKAVSIHLKDYKPKLFKAKDKKELRKENVNLYQQFEPDLIKTQLEQFLQSNMR